MTDTTTAALLRRISAVLVATGWHAVSNRLPYGHGPAPGSLAARQITQEPQLVATMRAGVADPARVDDEPVQTAFSQASMLMASASDHMMALAELLDPFAIYGSITVARGCVEAGARAWWLLDPGIGEVQRIGRSLTDRIYDLRQQRAVVNDMKRITAAERMQALQQIAEAIDVLIDMGTALGLQPVVDQRKRRPETVGVGERRPEATALVEAALPGVGGVLYRTQSATAHGVGHGLMPNLKADPNTGLALPTADLRDIGKVAMAALRGWAAGFEREVVVYGFNPQLWQAWRTAALRIVNEALR